LINKYNKMRLKIDWRVMWFLPLIILLAIIFNSGEIKSQLNGDCPQRDCPLDCPSGEVACQEGPLDLGVCCIVDEEICTSQEFPPGSGNLRGVCVDALPHGTFVTSQTTLQCETSSYPGSGYCGGTCTKTGTIATNECTKSVILTKVSFNDDGDTTANGGIIFSDYSCECRAGSVGGVTTACGAEAAPGCSATHTVNKKIFFTHGNPIPISVYALDDCKSRSGGSWGGSTAFYEIKSVQCDSGYKCDAAKCIPETDCGDGFCDEPVEDSSNCPADCQPEPPAATPKGNHDASTCTASSGWTCDADDYNQALSVHFYADGAAGSGGTMIGSTTANNQREQAVADQCGGNPNHGFTFPTPDSLKDGTDHSIYAYAINYPSGGTNPKLSGSPKTINCEPPPTTPTCPSDLGPCDSSAAVCSDICGGTEYFCFAANGNWAWRTQAESDALCDSEAEVCGSTYQYSAACGFGSGHCTRDESVVTPTTGPYGWTDVSIEDDPICSLPPEECVLESASWSATNVIEGTNVYLNVQGTVGCDGLAVSLEVREHDPLGNQPVSDNPDQTRFSGGLAQGSWIAEYQDDFGGDPEYFFKVLVPQTGDQIESDKANENLLHVTQAPPPPPPANCTGITICDNYAEENICNLDSCNVAEASAPDNIDCNDPIISCFCLWNTTTNNDCDFGWGGVSGGFCGDGIVQDPNGDNETETCDLDDWGGVIDCTDFGLENGVLSCAESCRFDTSQCTGEAGYCGDNQTNPGEECDDTDLGTVVCRDLDDHTGGELGCTSDCLFDTSQCTGGTPPGDFKIGKCVYSEQTDDNCDDGFLTFSWTAAWIWDEGNPEHQDPNNLQAKCLDGQKTVECPAQIPLPFFGVYNILAALILISLIYWIWSLKKK
jgi:hypothetical protein